VKRIARRLYTRKKYNRYRRNSFTSISFVCLSEVIEVGTVVDAQASGAGVI